MAAFFSLTCGILLTTPPCSTATNKLHGGEECECELHARLAEVLVLRGRNSTIESASAKIAGYMYHSPACVLPHMEKAAPIIGPNRNPRIKATPIRAIPFPLLAGVDKSVTIAVVRLTLHLEIPPMILASTKPVRIQRW